MKKSDPPKLDRDGFPLFSRGATELYVRMTRGAWYPVFPFTTRKTPKVMEELLAAGLVQVVPRVNRFVKCYVPVEGYTPAVPEKFADEKVTPSGRLRRRKESEETDKEE